MEWKQQREQHLYLAVCISYVSLVASGVKIYCQNINPALAVTTTFILKSIWKWLNPKPAAQNKDGPFDV